MGRRHRVNPVRASIMFTPFHDMEVDTRGIPRVIRCFPLGTFEIQDFEKAFSARLAEVTSGVDKK